VEERQCYQQKDMTMKQLIQQKDDIIHTKVSSYFGLVCQSQSGSKSYGCCSHSGHQACGAGAAPSSADPKHLVWGARGTHGVALAQVRTGVRAHRRIIASPDRRWRCVLTLKHPGALYVAHAEHSGPALVLHTDTYANGVATRHRQARGPAGCG
jgi:hypothetical protein